MPTLPLPPAHVASLLFASLAAVACGGSEPEPTSDTGDTSVVPDTIVETDTGELDSGADSGQPDTGDTGQGDVDTGVTTDTEEDTDVTDTATDADVPPGGPCDGPELDVLERDGAAVVTCDGYHLEISPLGELGFRLRYLTPDHVERPSWAVVEAPVTALRAVELPDDALRICGEAGYIDVLEGSLCRVFAFDAEGNALFREPEGGGFSAGPTLVREAPLDEHFYGLGENTGPLDRRGTHATFWNTDAYDGDHGGYAPGADPLYASIPFYIGLREGRAYGVLTDNTYRMRFDMAETADAVEIAADGGVLDQYVVMGPSIPEVVGRYTTLTGRAPLPPRWSMGYHQCRWGYSPDDRLRELATGFREREMPADVLWLDIQHMDGFRTFTWDPVAFDDPVGLAGDLHDAGYRLITIADPGIKDDTGWDVFDEGVDRGVFLNNADGSPFVGDVWAGPSRFPDFSNPEARAWWAEHIAAHAELGVDGIWLDVNEPTTFPESGGGNSVPNDAPVHGDGIPTTMAELHNVYGMLEAQATREGLMTASPDRRPFIVSRAGYAGIQRVAAQWTGDVPSTWHGLRETLPMMLNMGLSGQPNVGSDVGGYSGYATPELYARWMQLGLISPFFRVHTTNGVNDQEPWMFGTEVEDISRIMMERRYRWMPYIYSVFADHAESGAPVLRPLVYAYQDDPNVYDLEDQALFGPYLMVAPILEEGATERTVYFPEGRWTELESGAIYEGPGEETINTRLGHLPVFARQGAIVPQGPVVDHDGERSPEDPLFVDIYPARDATTFALYEDAGDGYGPSAVTQWTAQRTDSGATIRAERHGDYATGERLVTVRVRRVSTGVDEVRLGGRGLTELDAPHDAPEATGWWWDPRDLSLWVRVDDGETLDIEALYTDDLVDLRPPVEVRFEVRVPADTPRDTPVTIASDANEWTHAPLQWVEGEDLAVGTLMVPRGAWYDFKFARGDWLTVEKWPGCEEALNRYAFGAAWPVRVETVWAWRDLCE